MATSLSPLNELVNNIEGSVQGLLNDIFGGGNSSLPRHPTGKGVDAVLSDVIPGNWLKLSFPYTFSVVSIDGTTPNPFTDFSLPIAPNAIKQTEEFAISIKPTQGGTTVTHSGNRYKILNIKGTTGIHPAKGTGGAKKSDGSAIFQPKELKYKSGYEVFIRLRNWFRAYYEHKKVAGRDARGLRLVFKNYKDGEFLVVELTKFDMDRQAAQSFMYNYELEFKVISHLTFQEVINKTTAFEDALDSALEAIDTARGVFLRSQDILRQVESTYESVVVEPMRKTSLALKALLGVGTVAADMGTKAITNTVSAAAAFTILFGISQQKDGARTSGDVDPRISGAKLPNDLESAAKNNGAELVAGLGETLMAVDPALFPEATRDALDQSQTEAAALSRGFYLDTLDELDRVKKNAEDFFNLGDGTYDSLFDRTSTLSAATAKVPTFDELEVLKAFNDAATGIRLLLSTEDLFKSTFDQRIQDMIERFDGNIELFALGAARQAIYESGQTLERIAQRELGDSSRWPEIAELNGLKSPYVTDDFTSTADNVLKPGDKYLIPTPVRNGFSQVPAAKKIKTTVGLNELEKSLGSDLKLTKDFDLALSASGDFEVVSGSDNMAQAILTKLQYQKGELIRYPELGADLLIGRKFPPIETIKDGVVNTLLQDNRIQTVENLRIERDGPAAYISFEVKIKQVDIPIPIKIKV